MILPTTNAPTHRTSSLEALRRKEFLKLRLPTYVTPGEKENKIEKSENRTNL